MATCSSPKIQWTYLGLPAASGQVFVYRTGTTTPVTLYDDGMLATPTTNPITLDANGEAIFYVGDSVALRMDGYTADGALIDSLDPVYPVPNLAGFSAGAGGRNFLDNADFRVAQRGTSFSSISGTTPVQTLDRWFGWTGATAALAVSRQTSGGGINTDYVARVARPNGNASAAVHYLGQVIESADCTALRGQACTLSFLARCGSTFSATGGQIQVRVQQGTGTDQGSAAYAGVTWTGQSLAVSTSQALTQTLTRFSIPVTLSDTASEIGIDFSFAPTGTAGAGDYFEVGDVLLTPGNATAFQAEPYQQALVRCQRFLPTVMATNTGTLAFAGATCFSTSQALALVTFPSTARVPPTGVTASSAGHFSLMKADGTWAAVTSMTYIGGSTASAEIQVNTAGGFTAGNGSFFATNSLSASLLFTGCDL